MRKYIVLFVLSFSIFAVFMLLADKIAKVGSLNETEYLKLENLVFKQEITSRAFQDAQNEFKSSLNEICKTHGIASCRLDMATKSVVEIQK